VWKLDLSPRGGFGGGNRLVVSSSGYSKEAKDKNRNRGLVVKDSSYYVVEDEVGREEKRGWKGGPVWFEYKDPPLLLVILLTLN